MRFRSLVLVLVAVLALGGCAEGDREAAVGGGALDQIGKAHRLQLEAALRSAAVAEEAHFAVNGTYATSIEELSAGGLTIPPDVSLVVSTASSSAFCVQATHAQLEGVTLHYANSPGAIQEGPC